MRFFYFCILLALGLLASSQSCWAQSRTIDLTLPEVELYDLSDGFSSQCFEKTFQDASGLLWLKSCAFVGRQYNHHFTTFDGHSPQIPDLSGDDFPDGTVVQALDMTDDGVIYGVYSNEGKRQNGLFFLHTSNRVLTVLESSEIGNSTLPVVSCQMDGKELIVLFADTSGFDIKRLNTVDYSTALVVSQRYEFVADLRPENMRNAHVGRFVDASYINYYQGNYWVLAGGLPFYKFHEEHKSLLNIREAELGDAYREYLLNPEQPPIFIVQEKGDFILILPHTPTGVFQYDFQTDSYSELPELFPMAQNKRAGISKSAVPQAATVMRYLKKDPNDFLSLLLNSNGSIDSLVIPNHALEIYHCAKSAFSGNTLIASDVGLIVTRNEAMQPASVYLPHFPTRAIFPINAHEVMLNLISVGKSITTVDLSSGSTNYEAFGTSFIGNDGGKFVQRTDGKIWVPGRDRIGLIDLETRTVTEFPNRFLNFERFDLFNDSTLVIFHKGALFSWNPQLDEYALLYSHPDLKGEVGYLHELIRHSNGDIYAAIGEGLLKISSDYESHKLYGKKGGTENFRILSMTEDAEGRLWLGTYSRGIQVFDPLNESFKSVQISEGLLSNTIASIEQDGNGYVWAGTFNGVSCIDMSTFEVVTTLTERDGLANNESNRFSSGKFADGRIAIGSISGFSVIDPSYLSANSKGNNVPLIFLSAAYWKDSESGENIVSSNVINESIELPANQPNLRLDLALTGYLQPELHKFNYKIGDGPWHFAGTNHVLYLNGLVRGSYDIQVKGIDHVGNETANVLKIPIRVLPFFYQQWWFYLLCSLPFLGFGFAWVRRQKKVKQELIFEVELATAKLKHDKALIESQAAQLQELDEVKSRFFTNISHEFRTPLSVIHGMANLLTKHNDDAVKSSVGLIQKNTTILLNLINQILDLVKLEAGELQIDYVQSDITVFIKQVVDGIRPLADSKKVVLNLEQKESVLTMDFDKNKTFRILTNLLSNAIKFTPEDGCILVTSQIKKGQLEIIVEDNGRGIPVDKLPFIFDRFYQVDSSTTREGEGTGIGLNFTKELVELLGGTIAVKSTEGSGTKFAITLPIGHNAEIIDPDTLVLESSLSIVSASTAHEKTIDNQENLPLLLIIEDNADISKLLSTIFSKSYRIENAENGQVGIDKAIEYVPDFILSDVMMPIKDGIQVVDVLKNDSITSHIPIVLLTAKADMESRLEGLRRGADDYVSKPFHEEELKLRIKNILSAKQKIQARYQSGAPSEQSRSPELELEDEFILKVQRVLEEHLDNGEFGIKDFCVELGVSRMQLHNKLKALTGLSTSNYIRSLRLTKAQELVLKSDLNISEIGYAVGFSSHAYFGRSFSDKFGCAPSEMRERQV